MAHDGQAIDAQPAALLDDLLALTKAALPPVEDVLARATQAVRDNGDRG